jgi:LmbE family N-acetylglucosaminyl deacetylase
VAAKSAIAIAAHPDDIEFMMAGTLLLLKRAGYEVHYFNLSTGNCGSERHGSATISRIRRREAMRAAAILGARWHPPIGDDLELLYTVTNLRRVAAVIRKARPSIVLTHSPQDYMEDHMTVARLAVTAAFARAAPNFVTVPRSDVYGSDVAIYHAMPYGLRDGLRKRIIPGAFVNTSNVYDVKVAALEAHQSQQRWLNASQGLNSYVQSMAGMSREVGRMSRRFRHAEGWRRHLHLGFSRTAIDPLKEALGRNCLVNVRYERHLNAGE